MDVVHGYQHQLKERYSANLAIPEPWNDIAVEQAIDSLRRD